MKKTIVTTLFVFLTTCITWGQTDTLNSGLQLQELVVRNLQAQKNLPLTFSNLDRRQLDRLYYGADVPTVLQHTPGINAYSDNGTGIGYSFFRLRGMDQTRINTTVNGIPVNDPENQGVYFNNFADLLSSAEQIQVQRGIGTSTNGTSAFGGSVNVTTRNLSATPSANLSTGIGSFGSTRISAEVQTGMLNRGWMFYGRIGRVQTDGYRRNSGTEVQSYQFSLGYGNKRSMLKFNFFGGSAKSKLSYLGLDEATFKSNPRTNVFVNGEQDAFNQFFNQIQYSKNYGNGLSSSASLYYVKGAAPKFQYLANWYDFQMLNMSADPYWVTPQNDTLYPGNVMTSYRLDQRYYGYFVNFRLERGDLELNIGVHVNQFESDHFMDVDWATILPPNINGGHRVYFNTGSKAEQSFYVKSNYQIRPRWSVFTDIQLRSATFTYKGRDMPFRPEYGKVEPMRWMFFNPRIGTKYEINSRYTVYAMAGLGYREPTRFDYLQDDFTIRDIKQNEIKPEEVLDLEAGVEIQGRVNGKLNFYYMQFANQIVGTGALNPFGYPITGNVGKSLRAGLEADLQATINNNFFVTLVSSMSSNRISELNFTTFNTDLNADQMLTYKNAPLALSPEQIHQLGLQSRWFQNQFSGGLSYRYVSRQYLDNTGSKLLSIPDYQVVDFNLEARPNWLLDLGFPTVSIRINNLLDKSYASSGSAGGYNSIDNTGTRGQYALFFPAATRNYFVTLNWRF